MSLDSLSPRVNLEQSRKQAKDLVKAFRARDPKALDRIRWNHPRFRGLSDEQIAGGRFILADAQLVVAQSHDFESWPKLLKHIEQLERLDPVIRRYEDAADAIIAGDIHALRELLARHPGLVHQRSTRHQHAPLLHYVAANGVEGYRQISPPNAVEVATVLLDAGAEVDAESDAYGGRSTALELVATSTPPRRAGVQLPLMDLLLARGAAIDGVGPGSGIVLSALANGCPEAAEFLALRGARIDSIVAAAGVGRMGDVRRLFAPASPKERERALIMAARYGRREVVEYLLDAGVDVAASDGMTALHHATGRADLEMVKLLVARGAPLEKENVYGGAALANTMWFAYNLADVDRAGRNYTATVDLLIRSGARTDVYPGMEARIEAMRREGR